MVKVVANGITIADSENTVVVEGNHYFPPADVKLDLFSKSSTSYVYRTHATPFHPSIPVHRSLSFFADLFVLMC